MLQCRVDQLLRPPVDGTSSTPDAAGDAISIAVEDTGPGLSSEQTATVFEAFVTTKSHGMGLGLAICRMIVERHEGRLSVSSADPRGAIFRIILPRIM
jgi:signal transduction histidine kinase